MAADSIGCRGGCDAKQADEEAAARAGWRYLEITKGWRCGACDHTLVAASTIVGSGDCSGDPLAPHDRGALARETASTILAPSVPRNGGGMPWAPGVEGTR